MGRARIGRTPRFEKKILLLSGQHDLASGGLEQIFLSTTMYCIQGGYVSRDYVFSVAILCSNIPQLIRKFAVIFLVSNAIIVRLL